MAGAHLKGGSCWDVSYLRHTLQYGRRHSRQKSSRHREKRLSAIGNQDKGARGASSRPKSYWIAVKKSCFKISWVCNTAYFVAAQP
jgi:hypothetical protein